MSRYERFSYDELLRLRDLELERLTLPASDKRSLARLHRERKAVLSRDGETCEQPDYEIPESDADLWECGSNQHERNTRYVYLRHKGLL